MVTPCGRYIPCGFVRAIGIPWVETHGWGSATTTWLCMVCYGTVGYASLHPRLCFFIAMRFFLQLTACPLTLANGYESHAIRAIKSCLSHYALSFGL